MSTDRYALVIGGGVIGVCCAYFLAKRGAEVAVLERDQIGRGASYGNAGCIAPGHPPINRPGRIGQAVRSLFHAYTVPRADHTMVSWLRSFSRTCNQGHLKRAMRVLSPLGHATRELFDDLVAKEKIECCFRRNGYYEIYLTESGFEAAKREADFLRAYGFHPEPVSANSLWQRDPAISDRVVGGVFYPEAETIIPYQFVTELARRAESHGAEFLTNTEAVSVRIADGRVQGVLTRRGEFIESDTVILACGAYSARLVRQLGLPFVFAGRQGLSPRLRARHRQVAPAPVSLHTGRANGVLYSHERVVRLAATLEFSGVNDQIRRPRLENLTSAARLYLNSTEGAVIRWCGLRPCLSDGLPAVGAIRHYPGLFIATGHAMIGLTLGPVPGKMAEYILDGSPSQDIASLDPNRF